jgi:predicted flavoprotein YhiN
MMRVMLGGKSRHREQKRKALGQMYPRLYFIGEVIDVTGHLRDFNFH